MKNRRANFKPLTDAEIRELSMRLCADDQEKAEALLVLASDMRDRDSLRGLESFPFCVVREVAYSQGSDEAKDAQAAALRAQMRARKGGRK